MFKFLPLLWAGLQRRKLRTVFTLASVLIAFLLYGVLAAVKNGFSAGVEVAGADRLMTTHKVSFILSLPMSYWSRIRAVPGVRDVTHATWFGGVYQDAGNIVQMFPVDPESYLKIYSDYVVSPEDRARWLGDRSSALIGRAYAERFKWHVGDRVPLKSNIYRRANGGDTWEFNIAGIFDGAREGVETQQVLFHYDYFEQSLGVNDSNRGQVGWYIVQVATPDQSANVAAAVDALFANSPTETKTATEKAFVQGFANQAGNIGAMVVAVASAVFFTMFLVTANTMAQSVRERAAEIGVLKTLGFSDASVLGLVLGESLLITLLGGGGGLGIAAFIVHAMGSVMNQYVSGLFLNGSALLLGIALIIGLGLISGALPARYALRLRIVDALRQE
jgi:putative ABC transport system permease protein